LGLHRTRARLIVRCAAHLVARYSGSVPATIDELMTLPYVGRYAASAVASVVFEQRAAVLDANVARVYQRLFGLPALRVRITDAKHLWDLADRMVSPKTAKEFNWAILDLGGTVCTARAPRCRECPLRRHCVTGRKAEAV
jgi:A/G-specific adenine glycosylase